MKNANVPKAESYSDNSDKWYFEKFKDINVDQILPERKDLPKSRELILPDGEKIEYILDEVIDEAKARSDADKKPDAVEVDSREEDTLLPERNDLPSSDEKSEESHEESDEESKDSPEESHEEKSDASNKKSNYSDLTEFLDHPASTSTVSAFEKAGKMVEKLDKEIVELEERKEQLEKDKAEYEKIKEELDSRLIPANEELAKLKENIEPSWRDYFNIIGRIAIDLAKEKLKKPVDRDLTSFHERIASAFKAWEDNRAGIEKNTKDFAEDRSRSTENKGNLKKVNQEIADLDIKIEELKNEKRMHEGGKAVLEEEVAKEQREFSREKEKKAAKAGYEGKDNETIRAELENERAELRREYENYIRDVDRQISLLSGPSFARFDEGDDSEEVIKRLEAKKAEVAKKYEHEIDKLALKKDNFDRLFPTESRSEKIKSLLSRLDIRASLEATKRRRRIEGLKKYYDSLEIAEDKTEESKEEKEEK